MSCHYHRNGKPAKLTGIFQDITVSKLAGQEIGNLLQEKEIILKEVHHRVKNNMSTIFGLLTTQAVTVNDLAVQSIPSGFSRTRAKYDGII